MFPYVFVRNAEQFISFLKTAFDAKELGRTVHGGQIANARIRIGTTTFMVSDAGERIQPTQSAFYLYVENVDGAYWRAVQAGGTSASEPADQSYGDRTAAVKDAFGNTWYLATQLRETR